MCVNKYVTKKLDIDEQSCVDRCVFKYMVTYDSIRDNMEDELQRIKLRNEMAEVNSEWIDKNAGYQ